MIFDSDLAIVAISGLLSLSLSPFSAASNTYGNVGGEQLGPSHGSLPIPYVGDRIVSLLNRRHAPVYAVRISRSSWAPQGVQLSSGAMEEGMERVNSETVQEPSE